MRLKDPSNDRARLATYVFDAATIRLAWISLDNYNLWSTKVHVKSTRCPYLSTYHPTLSAEPRALCPQYTGGACP